MARVILVGLPGTNVKTELDPDKFALYADQAVDYILIKEKARGVVNVSSSIIPIAHGLTYVPMCLVEVEVSPGVWRKVFSGDITGTGYSFGIDNGNLYLRNDSGSMKTFSYYIFYDNIT